MTVRTLVPVKSLDYAKSRLAKHLPMEERKQLVLQMLDHVLSVLATSNDIAQIAVVTPDLEVSKHAMTHKAKVLLEGRPGHNPALYTAALHEKVEGAQRLLTISADLPLLKANDIQSMIELSTTHDVVLAPSKDNGTNAILMCSPLLLPYLFGKHSFDKYVQAAKKKGLSIGVYKSETVAFDVDTVEDLKEYNTRKALKGYDARIV